MKLIFIAILLLVAIIGLLFTAYKPENYKDHFKMDKIILLIIVAIVLIPLFLNIFCPSQLKSWLDNNKLFLESLNVISIIGLIFTIFLTVYHFNKAQILQESQRKKEFASQIETLKDEININDEVCDEILKVFSKDEDKPEIIFSRYHYKILETTIGLGNITNETLRDKLWKLYHYMNVANELLMELPEYLESEDNLKALQPINMNINQVSNRLRTLYLAMGKESRKVKILIHDILEDLKNL